MKKFVVYFETYDGWDEWEVFDTEKEAEDYIEEEENKDDLSPEEGFFIKEEER